jgi:DNA-binding transcriptional LysR family regulator
MNFTHAAQELHITQPAVSQHIHYLEELYQTALFDRDGKKIALTAAGSIFYKTMQRLQNDEQTMTRRMHEQQAEQKKSLAFGVTMTIGEYAIVSPLAAYIKAHPDTNIHVTYKNTKELLKILKEGLIDFALVEGYFKTEEYDTLIFSMEEYIPVCAASHVFPQKISKLEDLLTERLFVRESGSGTREILEKDLAAHDLSIHDFAHITEVENMHTIIGLLIRDCGIAFVYKAAAQEELARGTLRQIPVSDFSMCHAFTFLWNAGSAFSEDYQKICTELKGL